MNKDEKKTETKELEILYKVGVVTIRLTPSIVRRYLVHGKAELVTSEELMMFMMLCQHQELNPFLREAYLIKFSSKEPAQIVTGKETFTKRAVGIPQCLGWNAGIIVSRRDGAKKEIIRRKGGAEYDGDELIGGWAYVIRKDWKEPLEIEVSLKEYRRFAATGEPAANWKTMPATMIRKVALVQALREAFPERYSGMYSPEEMPVDDSKLPTIPVNAPEAETIVVEAEVVGDGAGDIAGPTDEMPPEVAEGASRAFDEAGEKLPGPDDGTPAELF